MLDKLGQRLIQELQNDGRQSYRELADELGVAEGTVRKRVRDLRNKDVIKIVAVPNPRKLGCNFICIIGMEVKLTALQQVGKELAQSPNVYFLSSVTGRFDLIAILLFNASEELADFVREKVSSVPGILKTETFVNMDILKSPWSDRLDISELVKL